MQKWQKIILLSSELHKPLTLLFLKIIWFHFTERHFSNKFFLVIPDKNGGCNKH